MDETIDRYDDSTVVISTKETIMRRINDIAADNVQRQYGHAGLWHDKYLPAFDPQIKQTHLNEVTQICTYTDAYDDYFGRWKDMLKRMRAQSLELVTQSRMIVGIGEASVRDIGIMLHHTYGVPFIPGSSLKGLAAAYARKLPGWDVKSESYRNLFGDNTQSGVVDFLDALWVPDKLVSPLSVDIINVHYQSYYTRFSQGDSDEEIQHMFMEAPVPNYFVCVKPKVEMLIAVNGPDEWAMTALKLIAIALDEVGVGAKTNAGYGRLRTIGANTDVVVDMNPQDSDSQIVESFSKDHLNIVPKMLANTLPNKLKELENLDASVDVKRRIAREMIALADKNSIGKGKNWYQRLHDIANT